MELVEVDLKDEDYDEYISSRFLATPNEIERLQALDGLSLCLNGYYGKHSEVYGIVQKDKIQVTQLTNDEEETLLKFAGKILEGPDIFYYYDADEMFYHVFNAYLGDKLLDRLSEEQLAYLTKRLEEDDRARKIFNEDTGRYRAFCYQEIIEEIFSTQFIREWNDKIAQGDLSFVEEHAEEFYELVFEMINKKMTKTK